MKRDLEHLEKQIQETEGGNALQKTNGHAIDNNALSNDKINDSIYKQINGLKDVAFINYLALPTIALISLSLIALVSWIISLF